MTPTYVEHVHCSRCGTRCSGVDPELGLVVRAWVECPECLERKGREQFDLAAALVALQNKILDRRDLTSNGPARAAYTFVLDKLAVVLADADITDTGAVERGTSQSSQSSQGSQK